MWREAPQAVRHRFQEQARIEKEEHQRKYVHASFPVPTDRLDTRHIDINPCLDGLISSVAEFEKIKRKMIKSKLWRKL